MRSRIPVVVVLLVLGWFLPARAWGEDDPMKALESRITSDHNGAALLSAISGAKSYDEAKAAIDRARKARGDAQKKQDLADYKEKIMGNLAAIKEMFAKAEESWKNQRYGEAGQFYSSVTQATVAGSEEMVETSRGRLIEMEDLASGHLKGADDDDIRREYVKEVGELVLVVKDFGLTKAHETALRRLITLRSRPEVAGYVELAAAEVLEGDGKMAAALVLYRLVASCPRYEGTVPAMRARRRIEELEGNEASRAKIKAEMDAKADREAPPLLNSARNFVLNNRPEEALEKLRLVIDKFPGSKYAEEANKYAEEARRQMAGLGK